MRCEIAKLFPYKKSISKYNYQFFAAVCLDFREAKDCWMPYRSLNFISAGRRHGECPNAYADTQGRYSSADPSVIVSVVPCARKAINSIVKWQSPYILSSSSDKIYSLISIFKIFTRRISNLFLILDSQYFLVKAKLIINLLAKLYGKE